MMFICFAATSSDMSFEQASVDEIHIFAICKEVGPSWRDMGIILKIDSALMGIIEANHSDCRELARKVLHKWKQREGSRATVGILIDALEKIERRDVVDKLRGM